MVGEPSQRSALNDIFAVRLPAATAYCARNISEARTGLGPIRGRRVDARQIGRFGVLILVPIAIVASGLPEVV